MSNKIIKLLALSILSVSMLAGCGKSKEAIKVENDIAAIGEVTLDEADSINQVSDYYNALTDKQKTQVTNVNVLEEAKEKLKILEVEEEKRLKKLEEEKAIQQLLADGMDYLHGANGKELDAKKALKCFEEADTKGNLEGSFLAGYIYDWVLEAGSGQDFAKAIEYYEKCMEVNPYAKACLGFIYNYGQGVDKDEEKAKKLWTEALDQMDETVLASDENIIFKEQALLILGSMYKSGLGYEQDLVKAVELYEKSSDLGNAIAAYDVAYAYLNGNGVEQDYSKAMEWYQKAAECDYSPAMYQIGYLYEEGNGVEQDYKKAIEWYQKAAELDNTFALRNMGDLYFYGYGVPVDYDIALEWYEKGAALGDEVCEKNIEYLKSIMW